MKLNNLFTNMKDKELEEAYHSYIRMEIQKEQEVEPLHKLIKKYKKQVGDKAAYPIMRANMFDEIARRWSNIYDFNKNDSIHCHTKYKPFLLIGVKHGHIIHYWLDFEEELIETAKESVSNGITITDALEIGSIKELNVRQFRSDFERLDE